ncbi:MAG: SAM-dependent methyltransferase [Chitinophagaceae bacterium]|nr:SAM-dependent methyltransferase [Chitinophagaceae bacterium]
MKLDAAYWEARYKNQETGWDIGTVSPPLKSYFEQLKDKSARILIPGAGNGHEAAFLLDQGFNNVFMLDISKTPLLNFEEKYPSFPKAHLVHENFFEHNGIYDLIIEQTFFCALDPALRSAYAKKMYSLLATPGTLAGLLFDDPLMKDGPPFGGTREEYLKHFRPYFTLRTFERATNSIVPRAGRELFMILKKENGTL